MTDGSMEFTVTGLDFRTLYYFVVTAINGDGLRADTPTRSRMSRCRRDRRKSKVMKGPKPRPVEERFWEKVVKSDTCWNWIGENLPMVTAQSGLA